MVNLIEMIGPLCPSLEVVDEIKWLHSKNGKFSVKSCREVNWARFILEMILNKIWKLTIPSKVSFFSWLCARDRLPTLDIL